MTERKPSAWLTELVGPPAETVPGRAPDIDPDDVDAIRRSDAYRRGVERAAAEAAKAVKS